MVKRWSLSANYTHQIGELTTRLASGKDTTYQNLIRRPNNAMNIVLGHQLSSKLVINATVRMIGKRKDNYYDNDVFKVVSLDLKAYHLLDLYAEYKFDKNWKIFADVRNVFDTSFVEVTGYQSRKFNATVGLSINLSK